MSTTSDLDLAFDVESFLQPIREDSPSGSNLSYEPEYDAIRNARRADAVVNRGVWTREAKVADWDRVLDLGSDCLRTRTKDIQIAFWMAEALGNLRGYSGLRDGFRLLEGIQEHFWDTYYPQIEDGDLENRHGPFLMMDDPYKGFAALIRNTPLTQGSNGEEYSYARFLESRETDNAVRQKPAAAKTLEAEGKIAGKDFDKIVGQTPKAFYVALVADLKECSAAFKAFEASTDTRFGRSAPSLLNIGKALNECLAWAEPVLAQKRVAEPDPEPVVETPPVDGTTDQEPTENGQASPGAGAIAVEGVSVPRRKVVASTGPDQEALDYGRLLIDFQERAKQLAEAGVKLKANRDKYAELLAELKKLDEEYDAVSRLISQSQEGYQLIAKLAKLPGMP
jgi:type VI secretion system protein ImpA